MTTSHLPAWRVWRTKPVTCGNQVYWSGTPSCSARSSAISFSNPEPSSDDSGLFAGSAQTRKAVRSTRSATCAAAGPAAASIAANAMARRILLFHARLLRLGIGIGLVLALGRPAARDGVGATRPQVGVDVVEVAHDVRVGAEGRHH